MIDLRTFQNQLKNLEKDRIHLLFFSYRLNWHNFYKNPLILTTKGLAFFTRTPAIDHVCHISRFYFDGVNNGAKIFEANMERGMEQNDLYEKLKQIDGTCYIQTLKKVDKIKAKGFEEKYLGVPYSEIKAGLSGIDGWVGKILNKIFKKQRNGKGQFCSSLVSLFLIDQGYLIKDNPIEITPSDMFKMNLRNKPKKILYKS